MTTATVRHHRSVAVLALVMIVVWVGSAAVARAILHARRGGGAAVRFSDPTGSPQWWSRVTGTVGFVLLVLGPIAELAGLSALPFLDSASVRVVGLVLAILGIVATIGAQAAMGPSWRGDVDPEAQTALVTTGPFRWIRNPIFTASAVTVTGIAMMVPNLIAVVAVVFMLVTYQIQVRLVEEPYLRRIHGAAYQAYAERTGRFLPWIGRARPTR